MAKADEYYAKQIMSGVISEKYSSSLDTLATKTSLTGKGYIDENRKSQLATILESYSGKNIKDLENRIKAIDARNDL